MAEFKNWNMAEFRRIRKSAGMIAFLDEKGAEWVERLNAELREAQAKRKQTVEDGYSYEVTTHGSRARLHIGARTARAQVHEARHSSILKTMHVAGVEKSDSDLPREYAERANEVKARKAAFLSHVRAFTNAAD